MSTRTQDFITGELTKLGRQWGIWPTEVLVNARIFDDLAEEEVEPPGQNPLELSLDEFRRPLRFKDFIAYGESQRAIEVPAKGHPNGVVRVRRINPPEDEG